MEENKIIHTHKPDLNEKVFFFGCGVTISVPLTLFIYQYTDLLLIGLNPFIIALFAQVIFAPFIEEFAKSYPLFYRHGETERAIFNLSLIVGLGFGIVEAFTYIFVLKVPLIYRLPGIFFHPASTAITGYGIAKKRPIPYYLIAVMFHLANNFISLTNSSSLIGSILIVSGCVFVAWRLRKDTKEIMIS